jgi:hypothetical protein
MITPPLASATTSQPPLLLDLVRQVARTRFGQEGPGDCYAYWMRPVVLFHEKRYCRDLSGV